MRLIGRFFAGSLRSPFFKSSHTSLATHSRTRVCYGCVYDRWRCINCERSARMRRCQARPRSSDRITVGAWSLMNDTIQDCTSDGHEMVAHSHSSHLGLAVLSGGEVRFLQAVGNEDGLCAQVRRRLDHPGGGHPSLTSCSGLSRALVHRYHYVNRLSEHLDVFVAA